MKIHCEDCKHYERYHQYPNPWAMAEHYCTKCNEEIKVNRRFVMLPKDCYFNSYFEESNESKQNQKEIYESKHFIQVE